MTDSLLEFNNMAKNYDGNVVLKDICANARPGDIIGLVGLNGSGKTTLLECALGFSPVSGGSVTVFGENSYQLSDGATKARIGFVPQKEELLAQINGKHYLQLVASFYPHWNNSLVERLCREWQIPLDKKILKLSVGQRQKLAIVSAIGHEPDLLVLDEPVASLDPMARRQFLQELVDIVAARNCTVVFSTHIINDLERVANRIWLLKDGLITMDAELDSLKEQIARIQLPINVDVPESQLNGYLLHRHVTDSENILLLAHWSDEKHRQLEQSLNLSLDPHWQVSLEDLFIEVHRT